MFGNLKRWTWLASGAPPFLVTAAARILVIALMAFTYVTISKSNYGWFVGGAILCGILGFIAVAMFDHLRERHVVPIPMVGVDGKPLRDRRKREVRQNVVVGSEPDLRDDMKTALARARKKNPGLSVLQFMSGFGAPRLNDPEALWEVLVGKHTQQDDHHADVCCPVRCDGGVPGSVCYRSFYSVAAGRNSIGPAVLTLKPHYQPRFLDFAACKIAVGSPSGLRVRRQSRSSKDL
jgi:hypothetical protein